MVECVAYRWSPGIGDPSVFGWATVLLYVVAAALSFMRARDGFAGIDPAASAVRWFWLGTALLLGFLAVNKQLDLQSLFTAAGRCLAVEQGWYGQRRGLQQGFILGLIALAVLGGAAALWMLRGALMRLWLVLTGLALLVFFVLMRASSFHHMDIFINTRLLGLKMNWIVEMGALALIIIGALRRRPDDIRNARS